MYPNDINSVVAALQGGESSGRSADGRVTARLGPGFELVELKGLELDELDRAAIVEAINAAIQQAGQQVMASIGDLA